MALWWREMMAVFAPHLRLQTSRLCACCFRKARSATRRLRSSAHSQRSEHGCPPISGIVVKSSAIDGVGMIAQLLIAATLASTCAAPAAAEPPSVTQPTKADWDAVKALLNTDTPPPTAWASSDGACTAQPLIVQLLRSIAPKDTPNAPPATGAVRLVAKPLAVHPRMIQLLIVSGPRNTRIAPP